MRHEVTAADTATAVGSGDVPVLATPRLIAWMEAATVRSAGPFLADGQTTVGTEIRVGHRRATPVGGGVEITATPPPEVVGRRLTFVVQAVDDSGQVVAAGEIDRGDRRPGTCSSAALTAPPAGTDHPLRPRDLETEGPPVTSGGRPAATPVSRASMAASWSPVSSKSKMKKFSAIRSA